MGQRYLSSSEVATILGIHRTAVARLIRQGKLPAIKVANRWLLERPVVDKVAKTYISRRGRPLGWSPKKEARE